MKIDVRKCMISDAPVIRELIRQHLGYEYPADKFEENLRKLMSSPSNIIYVAENGSQLLGYAHACDYGIIYGPPTKALSSIVVVEEYRRYGVANALMDAVEKWAKKNGAEAVRLYSGSERTDAVSFYKARGYEFFKSDYQFKKML